MDSIKSQNEKILDYMKNGYAITAVEALGMFGCFRLAARINDLRAIGYRIKSNHINSNGKRYVSYQLENAPNNLEYSPTNKAGYAPAVLSVAKPTY